MTTEALHHQQLIDARICPPEFQLDWDDHPFSEQEWTAINHAHGYISGEVQGPKQVALAYGLHVLSEIEGYETHQAEVETSRKQTERYEARALGAQHKIKIRPLEFRGSGDSTYSNVFSEISLLETEERWGEIMPLVVNRLVPDYLDAVANPQDDQEYRINRIRTTLLESASSVLYGQVSNDLSKEHFFHQGYVLDLIYYSGLDLSGFNATDLYTEGSGRSQIKGTITDNDGAKKTKVMPLEGLSNLGVARACADCTKSSCWENDDDLNQLRESLAETIAGFGALAGDYITTTNEAPRQGWLRRVLEPRSR